MSGDFSREEYQERLARLRDAMRKADVVAMLIDDAEILAYYTGHERSVSFYRACIVPLWGEPLMVLRSLDVAPFEEACWFKGNLAYADTEDGVGAVARGMSRMGLAASSRRHHRGGQNRLYGCHRCPPPCVLAPSTRDMSRLGLAARSRWGRHRSGGLIWLYSNRFSPPPRVLAAAICGISRLRLAASNRNDSGGQIRLYSNHRCPPPCVLAPSTRDMSRLSSAASGW